MSEPLPRDAQRLAQSCLFAISALALGVCVWTLVTVARHCAFPYETAIWPDDDVLNVLLKLRLGAPLYGTFADANSNIYAPGGVLLHHALLSPFGLDLNAVANRALVQVWLVIAVALGVRLVGRISEGSFNGRALSTTAATGAAAALMLAGYWSAVAVTLHPTTLEILLLTVAASVAAEWPRLGPHARIALCLLIPGICMLAKQTACSAAFALAAVALASDVGSWRHRLTCAAAALFSPALSFGLLQLATHGAFARWGLWLPLTQFKMWGNAAYLGSVLVVTVPALLLMIARGERAIARRASEPHAAWLRTAAIPIAYLPFACMPYTKVGGGDYDFGVPVFFFGLLALAQMRATLTSVDGGLGPVVVTLLAATQLALWSQPRHVPTAADRAKMERLCAHVVEALACGEKVLSDFGVTCLVRGGIAAPSLDRSFSLLEMAWAGLHAEAGTTNRLATEHYDLLVLHDHTLMMALTPAGLAALNERYVQYHAIAPSGSSFPRDADSSERARRDTWADVEIRLLERKRDAGRHRVDLAGPPRCRPAR